MVSLVRQHKVSPLEVGDESLSLDVQLLAPFRCDESPGRKWMRVEQGLVVGGSLSWWVPEVGEEEEGWQF